jgi:hypothetical protein
MSRSNSFINNNHLTNLSCSNACFDFSSSIGAGASFP